jgi:hypothetical protein
MTKESIQRRKKEAQWENETKTPDECRRNTIHLSTRRRSSNCVGDSIAQNK